MPRNSDRTLVNSTTQDQEIIRLRDENLRLLSDNARLRNDRDYFKRCYEDYKIRFGDSINDSKTSLESFKRQIEFNKDTIAELKKLLENSRKYSQSLEKSITKLKEENDKLLQIVSDFKERIRVASINFENETTALLSNNTSNFENASQELYMTHQLANLNFGDRR